MNSDTLFFFSWGEPKKAKFLVFITKGFQFTI